MNLCKFYRFEGYKSKIFLQNYTIYKTMCTGNNTKM